ncbi:MAG: phytanoyl-CoA dioxygenase family protein [Acidimicrobiales bacterium]
MVATSALSQDAAVLRREIEALTRAGRARRDPDGEVQLVRLRHALGIAECAGGSSGPSPWPPAPPDRFAGTDGLATIAAADLTAEAISSAVLHHGALLVRGLLSADEVGRVVEDTDRAIAAFDAAEAGAPRHETAPWFVPFEPQDGYPIGFGRHFVRETESVWAVDSPRATFDLLEVFERTGLVEAIAAHLGQRPVLSVKKWTLRRVPVDTNTDWHQDGAFLGDDVRTVNVWLTLSPCGLDAPGLDVVPRRIEHLLETGTHGARFDWSVGHGLAEAEAAAHDTTILRPTFEPGDALLFDQLFLHRTAVSPDMTRVRYAVESWFFAPTGYPHAQIPVAL